MISCPNFERVVLIIEYFFYKDTLEGYQSLKGLLEKKDDAFAFYNRNLTPLIPVASGVESNIYCMELTEQEQLLDTLMDRIRKKYRDDDLSPEVALENRKPYPASKPFYQIKDEMERCPLYQSVFRIMPKGGLLHVHAASALSSEEFFKFLVDYDREHPSEAGYQDADAFAIFVLKEDWSDLEGRISFKNGTLLYKHLLIENGISVEKAVPLCSFIDDTGRIKKELKTLLAFEQDFDLKESMFIWEEFNMRFSRTDSLLEHVDFYREYLRRFFEECKRDNIQYVELRSGFANFITVAQPDTNSKKSSQYKLNGLQSVYTNCYHWRNHFYYKEMNLRINYNQPEFLEYIREIAQQVGIGVRVILNVRRDLNPERVQDRNKIIERLDAAIKYHNGLLPEQKDYSDFVIGFDFVSEEDRGRATSEYKDFIYGTSTQQGISEKPRIQLIDFYLHDGESHDMYHHNIIDASIISKYRIGHGFQMYRYIELVNNINFLETSEHYQKIVNSFMPILEVCPISNQLLRYYPDLRAHPVCELMKRGVQCVIANDDPQIFGNGGLSYDFWMAYMGFGLNLKAIKRLIYNSLIAENQNKLEKNPDFDRKWGEFVQTAVENLSRIKG